MHLRSARILRRRAKVAFFTCQVDVGLHARERCPFC